MENEREHRKMRPEYQPKEDNSKGTTSPKKIRQPL